MTNVMEKNDTKGITTDVLTKDLFENVLDDVVDVKVTDTTKTKKEAQRRQAIKNEQMFFFRHTQTMETITQTEIATKYKDTQVYKMLKEGKLRVDSESIFVLDFQGKTHKLPNKKTKFNISKIEGFSDIGIQYAPGNRNVDKNYVLRLAESLKQKVHVLPCVMDINGVIYDGQSRIAAAMHYGLYVYVVIIRNPSKEMVMDLNAHSKTWTSDDKIGWYMENGTNQKDYTRCYNLMHLFDDHANAEYRNIAKQLNANRNTVYNMSRNIFWGGGTIKNIMDGGTFKMSEDTYLRIKSYLENVYPICIKALNAAKKNCLDKWAKEGYALPTSRNYLARLEFLQIALYHMCNARNGRNERLGDDMEKLTAFLNDWDVEATVDKEHKRVYGIHVTDIPLESHKTCKALYLAMLNSFDKWNRIYMHGTYDTSMSFYEVATQS